MSDAEIISGIKAGNPDAFKKAFWQYYAQFLSFTEKLVKDRGAAEDIMQEVFMKLWLSRQRLTSEKSLKNYLFVLTKRTALNYIRDNYPKFSGSIDIADIANAHGTDEEVDKREMSRRLMDTIQKMPEKRRRAFLLSRMAGLSNSEIAEEMGISVHTVNRHLSLALSEIKKTI